MARRQKTRTITVDVVDASQADVNRLAKDIWELMKRKYRNLGGVVVS